MKKSGIRFLASLLVAVGAPLFAGSNPGPVNPSPIPQISDRATSNTAQRVRHELLMLPYFTIFDNLGFTVNGNTVTLVGQVTRPVLKEDARRVISKVEGVRQVDDQIQVLPLSSFDNHIRWATARAVYGYPALNRYALGTQPSIHIVVNNGHVTLTGVVDNPGDKNIAGIRANSVAGVFSVTNDLQVAQQKS